MLVPLLKAEPLVDDEVSRKRKGGEISNKLEATLTYVCHRGVRCEIERTVLLALQV
jgi:hypothetical protein